MQSHPHPDTQSSLLSVPEGCSRARRMARQDLWRTWPHERQGEARPRIIEAQNIQISGVCGEEQYGQEE